MIAVGAGPDPLPPPETFSTTSSSSNGRVDHDRCNNLVENVMQTNCDSIRPVTSGDDLPVSHRNCSNALCEFESENNLQHSSITTTTEKLSGDHTTINNGDTLLSESSFIEVRLTTKAELGQLPTYMVSHNNFGVQCTLGSGGTNDDVGLQAQQQHSLLVLALRRRLNEQERLIRRLRTEKDEQLRRISSSLLLLESKLKREKLHVDDVLREKDTKIMEQDKCIRALLRLNRKLASGRYCRQGSLTMPDVEALKSAQQKRPQQQRKGSKQPRRISWHSEVSIYGDDGRRWHASYRETNGPDRFPNLREISDEQDRNGGQLQVDITDVIPQVGLNGVSRVIEEEDEEEDDDDEDDDDLTRAADEACDAFHNVLDGYVSDDQSKVLDRSSSSASSHPFIFKLRRNHPDGPPPGGGTLDNNRFGNCRGRIPNLGHVYNRVMSNHRSVTKPKDVKYKKISRVKSRSLEELRGRLRNFAQPGIRRTTSGYLDDDDELT